MSNSGYKGRTSAIICGALRSPLELSIVVSQLSAMRASGELSEVILSTWDGECERIPDFTRKILESGIKIVSSRDSTHAGPSNLWRQYRALDQGMRYVNADSKYVWKCRTDKMMVQLKPFIAEMANPLPESPYDARFRIFNEAVSVPFYSLSYPFLIKDISFLAERGDIATLCHFENWSDIAQVTNAGPEARWKSFPFFTRFPIFKEILCSYDAMLLSTLAIRDCGTAILPTALLKSYALYFRLMLSNFKAVYRAGMPDQSLGFEQLFAGKGISSVGFQDHGWWYSWTSDNKVLEYLMFDAAVSNPNHARIKEFFNSPEELLSWQYLSNEEHDQLSKFLQQNLPQNPEAVRRDARLTVPATPNPEMSGPNLLNQLGELMGLTKFERLAMENTYDKVMEHRDFIGPLVDNVEEFIQTSNIQGAKELIDRLLSIPDASLLERFAAVVLKGLPKLNGLDTYISFDPTTLPAHKIDSIEFASTALSSWQSQLGEHSLVALVKEQRLFPNCLLKYVSVNATPNESGAS